MDIFFKFKPMFMGHFIKHDFDSISDKTYLIRSSIHGGNRYFESDEVKQKHERSKHLGRSRVGWDRQIQGGRGVNIGKSK